jgi:putative addiction module component (TIGR02574 family)
MSKFSAADVMELPVAERLQLVEEIWDGIASNPASLAVTDADR